MSCPRRGPLTWALATCLFGSVACSDPGDLRISVVRVQPEAAPNCGAPDDARTMILRALGEFPASEETAQSFVLGSAGRFLVERFPDDTRALEAEVRGFDGDLRTVGRSAEFSLADLEDGEQISLFMAPLGGVCATGPAHVSRNRPVLAQAGEAILVVGGRQNDGTPSAGVEIYRPTLGSFETIAGSTYGDTSSFGLEGASITTLASGDVAVIGGAATAYQIFDHQSEEFLTPAFYREARGRHAAVALPDGRMFLAAGCSQIGLRGCVDGSELRTSSILDLSSGEIENGPSLELSRVGGTAWIESAGQVVLIGGEDASGEPVVEAERIFLDGRPSQRIAGLSGASAQAASGSIWAGLSAVVGVERGVLAALGPQGIEASIGIPAAFADSGVSLVALDDGSLLALGENGAQRIRTLEGEAGDIGLPGRSGQSALKLADGSVLIAGGHLESGEPAPALIFRPSLLGPQSASSTASFSSTELSEGLSARNPTGVAFAQDNGAHLEIQLGSVPEYVLVAGPRPRTATLQVAAAINGEGAAQLYVSWQSFSNHVVVDISPGTVPTATKIVDGVELVVGTGTPGSCEGTAVPAEGIADTGGLHEIELRAEPDRLSLRIDGQEFLACSLGEPLQGGAMGLGGVSASSATLRIGLISLSR